MPEFEYRPLDVLHSYPPESEWMPGDVEAWRLIYQQFGILRPVIVGKQTGRVLSPPPEIEALHRSRQFLDALPAGVLPGWLVPVYVVEVPESAELAACLILAGGVDRALSPRLKDGVVIEALLQASEIDPELVRLYGIEVSDLVQILETFAADDEPAPAPARPAIMPVGDADAWGVPELELLMEGEEIDRLIKWGSTRRSLSLGGKGIIHFYTDDSKFTALVKNPAPLVAAAPGAIIEPNFSTNANMPGALVLHRIYQKRALAAGWQAEGIRVFVDLNVDRRWFELALLGVPAGWRAYANRAMTSDLEHLEEAYELAVARRGSESILYLVYGGGVKAKEFCERRGWHWVPEESDLKRGRLGGA